MPHVGDQRGRLQPFLADTARDALLHAASWERLR
jgi:hypothetical protein